MDDKNERQEIIPNFHILKKENQTRFQLTITVRQLILVCVGIAMIGLYFLIRGFNNGS